MDKLYTTHYVLATYGNTDAEGGRSQAMTDVVRRYQELTSRIINALEHNAVEKPEKYVTHTFCMLGDHHDGTFHRKEMVKVDLEALQENPQSFQWESYGWVQAFQPLVDLAGYCVVEVSAEYPTFGPDATKEVDYVQPCFRIHEPLHRRHGERRKDDAEFQPDGEEDHGFFEGVGRVLKENAPTLIAVGSAIATFTLLYKTAQSMANDINAKNAHVEEVLHHIEDIVEDAIEMPQVVRVEYSDDTEAVGYGRRTW